VARPLDALVSEAKAGNPEAFEAIYRQCVGRVYALALRMEGKHGTAEDLTQEIFLRVWRALPSFRGDAALSTWIHGIAARTAVDRYRRFERLESADSWSVEDAPDSGAPRNLDLEAAIRALPPGMRRFFVLHAIEGYQLNEIAEMAGVAVGTVKSQVFAARQRLRRALGEHDE
jgi:RNA polymerase sigma-70 factor, ECF subfamily